MFDEQCMYVTYKIEKVNFNVININLILKKLSWRIKILNRDCHEYFFFDYFQKYL